MAIILYVTWVNILALYILATAIVTYLSYVNMILRMMGILSNIGLRRCLTRWLI